MNLRQETRLAAVSPTHTLLSPGTEGIMEQHLGGQYLCRKQGIGFACARMTGSESLREYGPLGLLGIYALKKHIGSSALPYSRHS
jgi:hypothetical protein